MSERLSFSAGDKEYDMNPENAFLMRYRQVGKEGIRAAMYDHVLLTDQEPPVYAWIDMYGEDYTNQLQAIMIHEGFTTMLNMPDVDEKTVAEYNRQIVAPQTKDLELGIPEAWL